MPVRLLFTLLIVVATMVSLFLFLLVTDTALSVWNYLQQAPGWVKLGYFILLVALPLTVTVVFWSWLRPTRRKSRQEQPPEISYSQFEEAVLDSSRSGVDVEPALAEIREQRRRKSTGEIYIAVHGEVSSGKSSLVKAMLPDADVQSDPRAGTTTTIRHYSWTAESGDRIVISDLPGFNFEDDTAAQEETRRSHLVIFLCEGDLTASQAAQVNQLISMDKPVVVALNKSDRYSSAELDSLRSAIQEKTGLTAADIVTIVAGGKEEIVRLLGEGIERTESRERRPEISALVHAVQRHLDQDRALMESLRDTSVLLLASEKLDVARSVYRTQQADELVARYSKRAVIGALAAVAPGSDLVIQGVLATQLMRELSKLYDVPVKEMEIDNFLKLAGGKLRNMTAITLAITGNALKAFPGLGTISGGLIHAVAYGMIFDSLGRAAAATLASRGALRPYPAAQAFEELLHENLESGAVRFARLAVRNKDK